MGKTTYTINKKDFFLYYNDLFREKVFYNEVGDFVEFRIAAPTFVPVVLLFLFNAEIDFTMHTNIKK